MCISFYASTKRGFEVRCQQIFYLIVFYDKLVIKISVSVSVTGVFRTELRSFILWAQVLEVIMVIIWYQRKSLGVPLHLIPNLPLPYSPPLFLSVPWMTGTYPGWDLSSVQTWDHRGGGGLGPEGVSECEVDRCGIKSTKTICFCVSGGDAWRDGGLSVRPGRPDRQRFTSLQEED